MIKAMPVVLLEEALLHLIRVPRCCLIHVEVLIVDTPCLHVRVISKEIPIGNEHAKIITGRKRPLFRVSTAKLDALRRCPASTLN